MILSHTEGLARSRTHKALYTRELELDCINSNFLTETEVKRQLAAAQSLADLYPSRVVLKESEAHEPNVPYFECSLFCYEDEVAEFEEVVEDLGLKVDILHELGE